MPLFEYKAVDPSGETVQGTMEAASADLVVLKLQEAGNIPLQARESGGGGFGLAGLRLAHVKEHFSDIAALAVGCGFADCTHSHEPNCAVRQAVADGGLLAERLASYHKIQPECEQRHWQRSKG